MGVTAREEQLKSVLDIVKLKNKRITNMENHGLLDEEILAYIEEVEQSILNYCRIPSVPSQLRYVWANMSVDLILYAIEMNNIPEDPLDSLDVSDLSSVKVGDTSVYIGDKYRSNQRSRILQSHNANLDEIVMNYTKQLNQFRRIW